MMRSTDTLLRLEGIIASGFSGYSRGDSAANAIRGMAGDDVIEGRDGDDDLDGGGGADALEGGGGTDSCTGAELTADAKGPSSWDFGVGVRRWRPPVAWALRPGPRSGW